MFIAFEMQPEGSKQPVGYKYMPFHMVFDVKAGTLQRKCRYVGDGNRTNNPDCQTYASVESRESVRIAFMLAALNGLELLGADCEGA